MMNATVNRLVSVFSSLRPENNSLHRRVGHLFQFPGKVSHPRDQEECGRRVSAVREAAGTGEFEADGREMSRKLGGQGQRGPKRVDPSCGLNGVRLEGGDGAEPGEAVRRVSTRLNRLRQPSGPVK